MIYKLKESVHVTKLSHSGWTAEPVLKVGGSVVNLHKDECYHQKSNKINKFVPIATEKNVLSIKH